MRSGYIAIVGRPNVGKSTLLNRLVGQKISITSPKPQTTRHRILGISSKPDAQLVYIDTPGLHRGGKRIMNQVMNRAASGVLDEADVVVFVVEAPVWKEEDEHVLNLLKATSVPIVLAINKVDRLEDKARLLPYIEELRGRHDFAAMVPISAVKGTQVTELEDVLTGLLPEAPALFPEDQVTDRSERFLAAELVREQLMRKLGQEVPYAIAVQIENYKEEAGLISIAALIWVEREGHKAIVIGRGGSMLKQVGSDARKALEHMLGTKVFLQLWVKVKENWSDDERALRGLGYEE
ncbi:MAG: GTPase Era [Chromatiales bacterium]|nr:GTPase Era [Chromatiales bacterium]